MGGRIGAGGSVAGGVSGGDGGERAGLAFVMCTRRAIWGWAERAESSGLKPVSWAVAVCG